MAPERRNYTVVTYAGDAYQLRNNIIFVEKLREKLKIHKQSDTPETVQPEQFDTKMSSWINKSKCTLLIFTPSFANKTWVRIFNQGKKTYNARTNAGGRLIPVIMPGFKGLALQVLLGTWQVLANKPIKFGTRWRKDEAAWNKLTSTIKALDCRYKDGECINLVEFSRNLTYITRNRIPPGKSKYIVFTSSSLAKGFSNTTVPLADRLVETWICQFIPRYV